MSSEAAPVAASNGQSAPAPASTARAPTKQPTRAATVTLHKSVQRAATMKAATSTTTNGTTGTTAASKLEPVQEKEIVYAQVTALTGSPPGGFYDGKLSDSKFSQPIGLAYDSKKGLLLVADFLNHRLRSVNVKTDQVKTVAGSNGSGDDTGLGAMARFSGPRAVCVDPRDGSYVVVDANRLRRVSGPNHEVSHIAGAWNSATEDEDEAKDGTGTDARFEVPNGLAIDPQTGTIYVADTGANQIRAVDPNGVVTTIAGSGAEDQSTDGKALEAAIVAPIGVALDATNQWLYISGEKGVRKLDLKTKMVSTLTTAEPLVCAGIALAGNGKHLLVTDTAANSVCAVALEKTVDLTNPLRNGKHAVTRLTPVHDNAIGGAPFNRPMGLAFDTSDDSCRTVFVADTFGERIRRVVLPNTDPTQQSGGDSCRVCGNDGGCTLM